MNRLRFLSIVAVLALSAPVLAQDKSAGDEKPWFDLTNCAMCKHMAAQPGLMEAMKWEVHKLDNGMLMVAVIPENMKPAMEKAHEAMEATVQELTAGKELPLCGFCESYGALIARGVKLQEFHGDLGEVSLMTSDDPEVVKDIHKLADRTVAEQKKLEESKGKAKATTAK
jgi:hypothetical protein